MKEICLPGLAIVNTARFLTIQINGEYQQIIYKNNLLMKWGFGQFYALKKCPQY